MHDEAIIVTDAMLHAIAGEIGLAVLMLLAVIMIPWEKVGWPKKPRRKK